MNWPSVWVKMASSWTCIAVYVVTIFIPKCLPNRDFSVIRWYTLPRARKRPVRGEDATVEEGQRLNALRSGKGR